MGILGSLDVSFILLIMFTTYGLLPLIGRIVSPWLGTAGDEAQIWSTTSKAKPDSVQNADVKVDFFMKSQ